MKPLSNSVRAWLRTVSCVFICHAIWHVSAQAEAATAGANPLLFDQQDYVVKHLQLADKTMQIRAYENIVYVSHPSDGASQRMHVYIPEGYFHQETINGFNAATAPIFFPNQVGGYMPSQPASLGKAGGANKQARPQAPMQGPASDATIQEALARGFVVASPGTRGRTSQNAQGVYIGKAPAAIVDLKAAVRYLRLNDAIMPGNAEKIISNGTSAGGALSALLGASGNSEDFSADLTAIGAAVARDDVFAVSAYCPITDLAHADAAYEWQFDGIYAYKKFALSMQGDKVERKEMAGQMDTQQIAVANRLKALFPGYVNSLKLTSNTGQQLTLDADGNGSFKVYIKTLVLQSAQTAAQHGAPMQGYAWLVLDGTQVTAIDYAQYLQQLGRQKTAPAFDGLALENGENQLFGDAHTDKQHFTEFSSLHDPAHATALVNPHTVDMMNPLYYIGKADSKNASFWRIRHGTQDKDTSLAIPALLSLSLSKQNIPVDFALAWNKTHSGDYDLDALFEWMQGISQ